MNLDNVVKRINRYLDGTDNAPRLVNAENLECMESLISRFDVSENTFLSIEKYSKKDNKSKKILQQKLLSKSNRGIPENNLDNDLTL